MAPATQEISNLPATAPKYIPLENLIQYANKGLSYEEIAKQVGCTSGNVSNRFKLAGYSTERIKAFKGSKDSIYNFLQSKFINSIGDEEIQKAPLQTKIWSIGVLHDKIMDLERKALATTPDDTGLEDLSSQLSRIAARSPIVINNILNIVGALPAEIRDRLSGVLPNNPTNNHVIDYVK